MEVVLDKLMEAVLDKLKEAVIEAGFECLKDQVRWQTGMKEELERLREIHPKIQAVVAYASTQLQIKNQNPALDIWLWQLRDAIDEADDVLDYLEYKKHEKQLAKDKEKEQQLAKNKEKEEQLTGNIEETKKRKFPSIPSLISSIYESVRNKIPKVGERARKIDPNLKRLEEVVQKLDKVSADVGDFLHLLKNIEQEQRKQQEELYRARETGAMPKNDQIGRAKEKDFVLQWLTKPSNEQQTTSLIAAGTARYSKISLLSVVGLGGMGKTTLLQHVYEDEMTNKEFDLKMWVCVSNNFDVKTVIAAMLESLKKKKPDLESLDALQESLKSEVSSKKFLLVLDDIWDKEEERDKSKWENVLAPLAYGSLGSKILVTTRMDSAASIIAKVLMKKKKEILKLEGLEEAECLQLLNNHAFADVENSDDHRKLRSIAGEIVKKLSGSPLAAKVMGGVLNSSLDESHWIKILNSDFINAESDQSGIMPILRLSYIFLPKHLQNCFTFCCIFPQDHRYDKDDLVRMWIALGFVQSSDNRGEAVEDIGDRYFDVLVKKSFFEKFNDECYKMHDLLDECYKMHDLLHELAQSVSARECFRGEGDKELSFKIPETVRHLSIQTNSLKVLKKIKKFKNLRTLYITYYGYDQYFVDVLAEIFEASISIRVLYIEARQLKIIPETIRNLIHLRYFKLLNTQITRLPRSLSNLYHLQFMQFILNKYLPSHVSHDFLPRDMYNLSNLHYLELPWDDFQGMYGIGKLNSLQNLDGFYVKNEIGYGIGELEHMNDLHQLKIKFLENVKDAEETCNAKLFDKRNLIDLSLEWGDIESRKFIHLDEKVLDKLQPQNCLKNLSISAYMGIRLAIWMSKADLISNLKCIKLIGCLELQTLPSFRQLQFLKSLYLCKMPKVKWLEDKFHGNDKDCAFPSLEVLNIDQLEALEDWFSAAAADDCFFPCLTELCLKSCPNLHELPYLPPKLEKLEIEMIGWRTLNCCSVSKSIPLESLRVSQCPNITYISQAEEIIKPAALRYLKIIHCPNLISLGGHQEVETNENCQLILIELTINDPSVLLMEPLRSITSVQKLTIDFNDDRLVSFPNDVEQWFRKVSSSLRELVLRHLCDLQSLPSSLLESLSSLKILRVEYLRKLQLLPNLPDSLERLQLKDLDSLQCLPSSLSAISSLNYLMLNTIPLRELPALPPSLCELRLRDLENLDCLPSCLPSLSSLKTLDIYDVPQLRELPNLSPSLCELRLWHLKNLDCLPSCLPSLSSLKILNIYNVPQLRELPDLPPSLCELYLWDLKNLDCLPSCLPSLSSLKTLDIFDVPQLRELPDLPLSLESLEINDGCHPELIKGWRR